MVSCPSQDSIIDQSPPLDSQLYYRRKAIVKKKSKVQKSDNDRAKNKPNESELRTSVTKRKSANNITATNSVAERSPFTRFSEN